MSYTRAAATHRELPVPAHGRSPREAAEEEDALDTTFRMRPVHEGTIHARLRHLGPSKPMVFVDDFPPED
jgi:hypothetical protein